MGTEGMKYSLVSRDVIADSIETACIVEDQERGEQGRMLERQVKQCPKPGGVRRGQIAKRPVRILHPGQACVGGQSLPVQRGRDGHK